MTALEPTPLDAANEEPAAAAGRSAGWTPRVVVNPPRPSGRLERIVAQAEPVLMTGAVSSEQFATALATEIERRRRGGQNGLVVSISLFEVPAFRHRLGKNRAIELMSDVVTLVTQFLTPLDVVNATEQGELFLLLRGRPRSQAVERLDEMCRVIAGTRFDEGGEHALLTPSAGYATLDGAGPLEVLQRASAAREVSATTLDLRSHQWDPSMAPAPEHDVAGSGDRTRRLPDLRLPLQILATYVLGLVVPFLAYWALDRAGADVSGVMYIVVVLVLVTTGTMILVESAMSFEQAEPPEPTEPFPPATAIISAYLPNEAATILDTLDAFLDQDYPGGLQVILAYNTPEPLPIERHLHRMAETYDHLDVVCVEGSTSKAQNINAVLHLATGRVTGLFDADHEPRPGSFERAWAWLSNGYDVVQGHCLTRNGDSSRLARMVAVEFESIYAVSHPGRARLHGFGLFGGSNGYWRTELLNTTKMRGSMLTEDIDSSLRVVERGHKIRSDRDIVSRELGTTTFAQLWNQRMRWAQGWFQVTLQHSTRVWRTKFLSFKQKLGMTYLLGWRELYPWLSLQMFPLIAYWLFRGDDLDWFHPVFVLTTLFVLHIGPAQTWFAYRLADPEIGRHRSWFVTYLFFSMLFYTEYKNVITRVAHLKEAMGERSWRVTPRNEDPVELEPIDGP